jgi:hypothetical protein
MVSEAREVLASDNWLNAPLMTVQNLMKMETLHASEVEIVKALVKWGKAQVQLDGEDPEDGEKLRKKIEPCLKLIRFKGLTQFSFADLSKSELCNVLSWEEKYSILYAVVFSKWDSMPVQFTPQANQRTSRESPSPKRGVLLTMSAGRRVRLVIT